MKELKQAIAKVVEHHHTISVVILLLVTFWIGFSIARGAL